MDKTETPHNNVDFSLVLASSVHDMKNSLCMLMQSIDTLSEIEAQIPQPDPNKIEEFAKLHYEASRLNTNLLQMLSFYRAEKNQLPILVEEYAIEDLLDEVLAKNTFYIETKNITVEVVHQDDIVWYLDSNLIGNLLNDVFVNAMRYTKNKITITATIVAGQLVIQLSDNGKGYPKHMLDDQDLKMQDLDLNNNRTGLGLFFAKLIAGAHKNHHNTGYIKLANDKITGGSVFTLVLP